MRFLFYTLFICAFILSCSKSTSTSKDAHVVEEISAELGSEVVNNVEQKDALMPVITLRTIDNSIGVVKKYDAPEVKLLNEDKSIWMEFNYMYESLLLIPIHIQWMISSLFFLLGRIVLSLGLSISIIF